MIWSILALLSAIFAALVTVFAKIGLARLNSIVATGLRAIVMTAFIIGYIMYSRNTPLLLNLSSKESIYILHIIEWFSGCIVMAILLHGLKDRRCIKSCYD